MSTKTSKAKEKKAGRLVPSRKMPSELMVGDKIVVNTDKDGFVTKANTVQKIVTGYGCCNIHVNGTACYDRSVPIVVAVPVDQASPSAIDEVLDKMLGAV